MGDMSEHTPSASEGLDNKSLGSKVGNAASSSSGKVVGDPVSPVPMRDKGFRSVVEDQGVYKSTCGYCKRTSWTSIAHGLWAFSLTVQDYQGLIDRGWRRSGMFLYKPHMKSTCCPPYTIRLKAESFLATKDQRRVLRRMERYLDGTFHGAETVGDLQMEKAGKFEREPELSDDNYKTSVSDRDCSTYEPVTTRVHSACVKNLPDLPATNEELVTQLKVAIEIAIKDCIESHFLPHLLNAPQVVLKRLPQKVKAKLSGVEGDVHYTSSIAYALVRRKRQFEVPDAVPSKDREAFLSDLGPEAIADMLAEKISAAAGLPGCTVTSASGHLNFIFMGCNALKLVPCNVEFFPYQTGGRRNSNSSSRRDFRSQKTAQAVSEQSSSVRKLEIRLKRSSFDPEEFALYQKYQIRVHNDRPEAVRESRYRRFLVDSPLIFEPPKDDGNTPTCGFGSFHQQYLVDGKLIAVGVIDILPQCLSSKYLFWDPDMSFLGLGKYAALKEISWVQEAQKLCPALQFYYLGFYIHSCPKMRYKAAYHPSELLCPESFRWVPYDICVPYLDKASYVCLSDIRAACPSVTEVSSLGVEEEESRAASVSDCEESEDSGMEIETDLSEVEQHKSMDIVMNILKTDVTYPVQSNEILDALQLCWKKTFISFKHVREFALIPQWHLYTLSRNLNKYIQDVGPSLASRMAYALG